TVQVIGCTNEVTRSHSRVFVRSWSASMDERRRHLTAEERFAELQRDKARVRRERMLRELAGPLWKRIVRITPAFFQREGLVRAHVLRATQEAVIGALREDAIFAVDTAMRITRGFGFLSSGDIQAYRLSPEPIARLARAGLIASDVHPDDVLV